MKDINGALALPMPTMILSTDIKITVSIDSDARKTVVAEAFKKALMALQGIEGAEVDVTHRSRTVMSQPDGGNGRRGRRRGPGRPRKRRGPGRPRKSEQAQAASVTPIRKRGRGRPRKMTSRRKNVVRFRRAA